VLYKERGVRREYIYNIYITYITYKRGFLGYIVVYLKDHSPYPDSSLLVVNLRI